MKQYRLVMVSTEPESEEWFVIWPKALCKDDVIRQANKDYVGFEVDELNVTEII